MGHVAVEVGQRAPEVTLVNYERKAVKTSDLRGKPTVLAFFPGALLDRDGVVRFKWVAPSQGTEPDYQAVEAALRALGN